MGQSHGSDWKGYDAQLLGDTVAQTIVLEDKNRPKNEDGIYTASNIIRNLSMKGKGDGFPGFMDDPNYKADEKSDNTESGTDVVGGRVPLVTKGRLCTGWSVWKCIATNP